MLTLDDTLAVMRTLDAARADFGPAGGRTGESVLPAGRITAIARRSGRIELAAPPRHHNNTLRAWESLPLQGTT